MYRACITHLTGSEGYFKAFYYCIAGYLEQIHASCRKNTSANRHWLLVSLIKKKSDVLLLCLLRLLSIQFTTTVQACTGCILWCHGKGSIAPTNNSFVFTIGAPFLGHTTSLVNQRKSNRVGCETERSMAMGYICTIVHVYTPDIPRYIQLITANYIFSYIFHYIFSYYELRNIRGH